MNEDLRCRSCRRLVARRLPSGSIEIRARGRLVAQVERGAAYCVCGSAVAVSGRTSEIVFRGLAGHSGEAA